MAVDAIIRTFLAVDIIILALLALLYLRQRSMAWYAYFVWGILAVFVPVIGPFFVIASRPGRWNPSFSLRRDIARCLGWMRCLLPDSPSETAPSHPRPRRQLRLHR